MIIYVKNYGFYKGTCNFTNEEVFVTNPLKACIFDDLMIVASLINTLLIKYSNVQLLKVNYENN